MYVYLPIASCINVDDLGTPSEDLSCLELDSNKTSTNSDNIAALIAGPIAVAVTLLMFIVVFSVAMILAKRYYQRKLSRHNAIALEHTSEM